MAGSFPTHQRLRPATIRALGALVLATVLSVGVSCSDDKAAGGSSGEDSDAAVGQPTDTSQSTDTAAPPGSDASDDTIVAPDTSGSQDTGSSGDTASSTPDTSADTGGVDDGPPEVVRLIVMGDTGEGNDAQKRVAEAAQDRCDEAGGRRTLWRRHGFWLVVAASVLYLPMLGNHSLTDPWETHYGEEAGGCHGFLMLGDNIYDTGPESADDTQFDTKIDQPYQDLKYGAPPASGQADNRRRMPIYVTLGNHDLGGAGLNRDLIDHYLEYAQRHDWFYFPSAWWETKVGNVHLMALETNALAYLGRKTDEHGQMVEQVLSSTDAKWTIALGHHPYRSNGQHGNAGSYEGIGGDLTDLGGEFRQWIDDYVCNKVDFYLSGHDHNRQWMRSVPDIPSYWPLWESEPDRQACNTWFAVSGAGAKTRDMEDRDNDLSFGKATLGFLFMEFHDDKVIVEYVNDDALTEWQNTLTGQ